MKQYQTVFLFILLLTQWGFSWNTEDTSDTSSTTSATCSVTSASDSSGSDGTLRRKVEQGFNYSGINGKNSCYNKIKLKTNVTLTKALLIKNNLDTDGVTIVGEGSEPRVINVSGIAGCAISVESNKIKLDNVVIRGAKGNGLCLKSNYNEVSDSVFENNLNGISVSGEGNTVSGTIFRDNDIGVVLEKAKYNELTKNSYYNNDTASFQSPETDTTPVIQVVVKSAGGSSNEAGSVSDGSTQTPISQASTHKTQAPVATSHFVLTAKPMLSHLKLSTFPSSFYSAIVSRGSSVKTADNPLNLPFYDVFVLLAADVDRVEVYSNDPASGDNTYLGSTENFISRSATIKVPARSGDSLYAVAFKHGTTSSPSTVVILDETGGFSTGGTGGSQNHYSGAGYSPYDCDDVRANPNMVLHRSCAPGVGSPALLDTDCDGIYDNDEAGTSCYWSPALGGSDPLKYDTDGDGLNDGLEDKNRNGRMDLSIETDPLDPDTDGDFIDDGVEDHDQNGVKGSRESDPTLKDTDHDGIDDNKEDSNWNGIHDEGETMAYNPDTDQDGLSDSQEDKNKNGRVDFDESDPRLLDSDDDGLSDDIDLCPLDADTLCEQPCIPGQLAPLGRDTDHDGMTDREEDQRNNCIVDSNETDWRKQDTDGDGLIDTYDACPRNPDVNCVKECNVGIIVPAAKDSDSDGAKDVDEDKNHNCIVDGGETSAWDNDSDDDGILDGVEIDSGLDPLKADTDNDGLSDKEEDLNGNGRLDLGETDPTNPDTDGDGLDDQEDPCPTTRDVVDASGDVLATCEDECVPGRTPPARRDSDQDGIPDAIEAPDFDCIRDVGETDPYNADTDGDGLRDGLEDLNANGIVDDGETDPRDSDSDQDGITDGNEDANKNGRFDFGELNPQSKDSDGDGIEDRFEDLNKNGQWDSNETSGYIADTDRDGLSDGEEDVNRNGLVDAGETDPRLADTDGDGALDNVDQFPTFASSKDLKKVRGNRGNGGCSLNASVTFGLHSLWMLVFIIHLVILRKKKSVTTF